MKFLPTFCASLLILMILVVPVISSAAGLVPCDGIEDCTYDSLWELVNNVIDFLLFVVAVPLTVVVISFAGMYMVIYSTNEGKRSEAKGMIKTAIIGLILALSAYLIIQAIVFGFTGQSPLAQRLDGIFK